MIMRLFSILAAILFVAGAAPAARAELADLGTPIDPHGFPAFYQDTAGLQLEPCLPSPAGFASRPELCVFDPIDPESPLVVAGEIFWWMASATINPVPGGGRAVLTLGVEGTFGGPEAIVDGQQISFGRTRIRVDTPVAGTYTVTYPYGELVFEVSEADLANGINYTSDIGAANFLDPVTGFRGTLAAPLGPFLTWENYDQDITLQVLGTGGEVLEQYVGDPRVPSPVVGSPTGNNFFRVQGPEGSGFDVQTSDFLVMGKVYELGREEVAHFFPEAPFPVFYAVGPVNRVTPFAEPTTATVTGVDLPYPVGYPIWYQENAGTITEPVGGLKLTLCTPGDPMCISDPILNPGDEGYVEGMTTLRTGGEGFWWSADAIIDNFNQDFNDRFLLVLGLEATFGGDESLIDGQQITFTRERIRIDTNVSGAGTYRITHPYAQRIFTDVPADDNGIDFTGDFGIVNPDDPDGAFVGALYALGPQVLKWTTFNPDPALTDPLLVKADINDPSQTNYFVGDPAIPMTVAGSPTGNNFFRVEKLVGEDWVVLGETDQFLVSGQVFDPTALPGLTPLNETTLFVQQLYRDFLNREGDLAGVQYWVGQLETGAISRAQAVELFLTSPDFAQNVAPLVRFYFSFFDRLPDYQGLSFWLGRLAQGTSLTEVANIFAGTAEFQSLYGSLANQEYVQQLYQNLLGREADAGGLAYWTDELDSGRRTRGEVMAGFAGSSEYTALTGNSVYVTMVISGLLHRAPEPAEFDFWLGVIDGGTSGLLMIDQLLASPEFTARF